MVNTPDTLFFFFFRFYLFIHETHTQREAETQAEGGAGSMRGARCGTQSPTPGSQPKLKADAQPLSPQAPQDTLFLSSRVAVYLGLQSDVKTLGVEGRKAVVLSFLFFFFLRFYLCIHERHRERGRDTGRGRSRLHAGSLSQDSILGLQDHSPGCRRR